RRSGSSAWPALWLEDGTVLENNGNLNAVHDPARQCLLVGAAVDRPRGSVRRGLRRPGRRVDVQHHGDGQTLTNPNVPTIEDILARRPSTFLQTFRRTPRREATGCEPVRWPRENKSRVQ